MGSRPWPEVDRGRDAPPRRGLPAALVILLALAAATARAEGRTVLSADLYARWNPLGLTASLEVARRRDRPDGDGPLFRGRYLRAGAALSVNPAWVQLGPRIEWVPWAPLQLGAGYDLFGFFGAYGTLLRLPSDRAPFGRSALDALSGEEQSGLAHRLFVEPTLRARVGRVLLRSENALAAYRLAGREGTYYESEYDTLLRERDLLFQSRTTLTAELGREGSGASLLAGPAYEYTRAARTGVERQRVGALVYWVAAARGFGLDRPRLLVFGGVDLVDRNRRGEPFGVVGLGGDLDL